MNLNRIMKRLNVVSGLARSMVGRRSLTRLGRTLTSGRMRQLIVILTMLAAATPTKAQSPPPEQYRIVAGDKVNVAVFGQPDLSGESTVDQNGNLRWRRRAAGLLRRCQSCDHAHERRENRQS